MFKCTGVCAACGRCKGASLIKGTNRKNKLLALPEDFKPDIGGTGLGASFDIGTTTVAGTLWDFSKGMLLESVARTNPQSSYGADVIARINFCDESPENAGLLRKETTQCLNEMLGELCRAHGRFPKEISKVIVAGNTTMSHLFAGHSPSSLARAPFAPAYAGAVTMKGRDSQLDIEPEGDVVLLPNIAGHVGGDITAGIVAVRLLGEKALTLFIDIGTNGEIVLTNGERTLACSTAAGPAFEGAAICQGMRAASGAIELVEIEAERVCFSTVEQKEPIGICGSGLIDAVAQMRKAGVLDETGRIGSAQEIPKSGLADRLREGEAGREFVLVFKEDGKDIILTQKDIREVQLAKGAIAAGISVLLREMEAEAADIKKVLVAGAFGNFINKESAMAIGLLPELDSARIQMAGNTAGAGALMALASSEEAELAEGIPELVEHVELALHSGFQDAFMKGMGL